MKTISATVGGWLYWPSVITAWFGVVALAACMASQSIHDIILRPTVIVEASVASILFIRAVFDSRVRRGIDTLNRRMARIRANYDGRRRFWSCKLNRKLRGEGSVARWMRLAAFFSYLYCVIFVKEFELCALAFAVCFVSNIPPMVHLALLIRPDRGY
jgi:hypothetical protein